MCRVKILLTTTIDIPLTTTIDPSYGILCDIYCASLYDAVMLCSKINCIVTILICSERSTLIQLAMIFHVVYYVILMCISLIGDIYW